MSKKPSHWKYIYACSSIDERTDLVVVMLNRIAGNRPARPEDCHWVGGGNTPTPSEPLRFMVGHPFPRMPLIHLVITLLVYFLQQPRPPLLFLPVVWAASLSVAMFIWTTLTQWERRGSLAV